MKLPTISAGAIAGRHGRRLRRGLHRHRSRRSRRTKPSSTSSTCSARTSRRTSPRRVRPGPLVGRTDLKDVYSEDPLVNKMQAWGVEESNTFWPDNTLSARPGRRARRPGPAGVERRDRRRRVPVRAWTRSATRLRVTVTDAGLLGRWAGGGGRAAQAAAADRSGADDAARLGDGRCRRVIMLAVLVWYPVASTVRHSFTDWNGLTANWVGLENYTDALLGGEFFELFRTNLMFLASIPPLLVIVVVGVGAIFDRIPGWRMFRSVYYLPTVLVGSRGRSARGIMFAPNGAVNAFLGCGGTRLPRQGLVRPDRTGLHRAALVFFWQSLGQGVLDLPRRAVHRAAGDGRGGQGGRRRLVAPSVLGHAAPLLAARPRTSC